MPAPKIVTTVEDQSLRVNSSSSYNAAIVIPALKGPVNKPVKVANQTDFLRRFTPNERIEYSFDNSYHEAYKYLESQGGLYVVRAAHTELIDEDPLSLVSYGYRVFGESNSNYTLPTAGWSSSGFVPMYDPSDYIDSMDETQTDEALLIYGTNPGAYNNDIGIKIITDPEVVRLEGAFKILVYKKNKKRTTGNIQETSKTQATLLETFTCSMTPTLKNGYGVNCFVETVLDGSNYIKGKVLNNNQINVYSVTVTEEKDSTAKTYYGYADAEELTDPRKMYKDKYLTTPLIADADYDSQATYTTVYDDEPEKIYPLPQPTDGDYIAFLEGGSNGGNGDVLVRTGDLVRAVETLSNVNDVDIQLIMQGGYDDIVFQRAINSVCKMRDESTHGILNTPFAAEMNGEDALQAILDYRKEDLNLNSYSCELYSPHQLYYDEFNDRYLWLSPGPYVASLIMKTAIERGWHWAVAGYNRGIVDSLDVNKAFSDSEMDSLSDNQINSIKKEPGSGNIIWDELTLWNQAADLQDAHITRWVNIYLRPRLKTLLRYFLFEFNDEETRSLVVRKISTFMEPQKSNRACYAYRVVCNETNNLDDDIENNRMNVWLYIKPTKIAKEIRQRIILTPYSTNLEDLEI